MNINLNELEAKIQQLFDEGELCDSRVVFDIGVQFGTLLQQQNIKDYDFNFWKKRDNENNKKELIGDAVRAIDNFLLKLVQNSIKYHIRKNGSWDISKRSWSSTYDSFDAGTLRKYCVQITCVSMTQYGGDFECRFKVVGRLAKLFKTHNISEQFDVSIYNENGEDSMSFYDTDDIESTVNQLNCHVRNINNWELEEYQNFLHVISKDFLFEIIKES